MPAAYAGAITRGLASDNPALVAVAAEHLNATLTGKPEAAPFVIGDGQTIFAATVAAKQKAGFDAPQAVKQAQADVKEVTAEQRRARGEAYALDRKKQEDGNLAFFMENGGAEADAPKFNTLVERFYLETGDIDAARGLALAAVKRGSGQPADTEGQQGSVSGGEGLIEISGSGGHDTLNGDGGSDEERGIGEGDKRTRAETFDAFKRWFLDGQLPRQVPAPDGFPPRYKFGRRTLDRTALVFLRHAANATKENVEQVVRNIFDSNHLQLKQKGRLALIAREMAKGSTAGETEAAKFLRLSRVLKAPHLTNIDAENADIERRNRNTVERLTRVFPVGRSERVLRRLGATASRGPESSIEVAPGVRITGNPSSKQAEKLVEAIGLIRDPKSLDAVGSLISGGKLVTDPKSADTNILQKGDDREALDAWARAVRRAGGDPEEIAPIERNGILVRTHTAADGTKIVHRTWFKSGGVTVEVQIVRPPRINRVETRIKIRYRP